jgi:hypothetical protein
VVDDAEEAIEILKTAKILAFKSPALAVEVGNHPGALGDLAERLFSHGVEIDYAYGSGTGQHAALILGVSDLERAVEVLEPGEPARVKANAATGAEHAEDVTSTSSAV